jgi:GrpB-like predicted nucleotidyltransferase (UPF0157 family)
MDKNPSVVIGEYDAQWSETFQMLKRRFEDALKECVCRIEHIGSTSVEGLPAKPVIDLDLVLPAPVSFENFEAIKRGLENIGYVHRGNLGIPGRDAFKEPDGDVRHNLYVCQEGVLALENHLRFRDFLRSHPSARDKYAALKRRLAREFPNDIDRYCQGKTEFICAALADSGLASAMIEEIRDANTGIVIRRCGRKTRQGWAEAFAAAAATNAEVLIPDNLENEAFKWEGKRDLNFRGAVNKI